MIHYEAILLPEDYLEKIKIQGRYGLPDIVCGYKGVNLLVEIKDPDKPPSARKLTPLEEAFKESWGGSYIVATDYEEVWEWYQSYLFNSVR